MKKPEIVTLNKKDYEKLLDAGKEKEKIEREFIETVAKLILLKHKYAFEVLGQ
jgi:hypothetical protein